MTGEKIKPWTWIFNKVVYGPFVRQTMYPIFSLVSKSYNKKRQLGNIERSTQDQKQPQELRSDNGLQFARPIID